MVVNGRTSERVERAMEEVRGAVPGAEVTGVPADLGSAEGCAQVETAVPAVDILVNNVGIFEPKPFLDIPDEDWLRFFEVNVMSGVRLSRFYVPGMLAKDWGRIVFVSGESAVQIPAEMIHYGMTKTAQVAVARGIAETLSGTGVTANTVLPGPSRSEGVATFVAQMAAQSGKDFDTMEKEFFATARPSSLLRRFITVEEMANLIVYLASPASSATNGAALRVDGGVVRAILWADSSASSRIGSVRTRTPVAWWIALAIAGATPMMPISPTPLMPSGLTISSRSSTKITSTSGTSALTGT